MHRPFLSAPLVIGALLGSPAIAAAQAPDPQRASAAQALFDEANDEMEKKRYATACPKLEEVTKLIPDALGARMALAECYEGLGKRASAWSQYALVEGLATKAGQAERAGKAGKRAADLKPRLATLTIEAASGLDSISGLTITRDGLDLGKAQWGVAVPVDVGSHALVVAAPGYKPWKRTVEVLADGARTVIKIPMLTVDPSGGAKTEGESAVRPWQRPLAFGAMATGGASLAVGALLGGLAIAKNDESNRSACNAYNQCTEAGIAMRNQALAFGNGSTATIVAGGILAAGGVVLLLTAPRSKDKAPPKTGFTNLVLGATPGGLRLEGAW